MRWAGAVVALFVCLVVCLLVVATRIQCRVLADEMLEHHWAMRSLECEIYSIEDEIRRTLRPAELARRWRTLVVAERD